MFSQACVKNSVHGGGGGFCPTACWDTPPPRKWPLQRTLHILLECILVYMSKQPRLITFSNENIFIVMVWMGILCNRYNSHTKTYFNLHHCVLFTISGKKELVKFRKILLSNTLNLTRKKILSTSRNSSFGKWSLRFQRWNITDNIICN